jgi:hypothetical protein
VSSHGPDKLQVFLNFPASICESSCKLVGITGKDGGLVLGKWTFHAVGKPCTAGRLKRPEGSTTSQVSFWWYTTGNRS